MGRERPCRHEFEIAGGPDYLHDWYDHCRLLPANPARRFAEEFEMELGQLKDVVRQAALLNIRFYASVLDLWRDLLHALMVAIEVKEPPAVPLPVARNVAAVAPLPPLVLAARAGEKARGTFAIVNTLQLPVAANVEIAWDIDHSNAEVVPQGKMLRPGEECAVQIAVAIDASFPMGDDRHATISVPGLASRSIPIIARRLPDPEVATAASKATSQRTAAPPVPASQTRVNRSIKKTRK
jgi:hypothetical protein